MDKLIKINKRKDEMIFGNIPYPNIHNLYDKKDLIYIPEKIIKYIKINNKLLNYLNIKKEEEILCLGSGCIIDSILISKQVENFVNIVSLDQSPEFISLAQKIIKQQEKIDVNPSLIQPSKEIKSLGSFPVLINFHHRQYKMLYKRFFFEI